MAAGVGMRNLGYGHIAISGIPAASTVKAAFLLWDVLDNSQQPADASGSVNGTAVTGQLVGSGPTPCWPAGGNYAYEADVTSFVSGNGSYSLTGFPSGATDGSDPWNSGSPIPELEGASLVVIYANQASPDVFISLSGGAEEGGSLSASLSGFAVGSPVSAKTTFIVADGQSAADGPATFNGTALQPGDFQGLDPQDVPAYSQGNMWDTANYDVSSLMQPGDTSATATIDGTSDCLVWVGQAMSVTMGSTSPNKLVVAFGDSVAAGEGLGPSTGWPDNTSAYPSALASGLGWSVDNFSISGACANGCSKSILQTELPKAEGQHLSPGLVTITVGADDIKFSNCFTAVLGISANNPCSGSEFQNNLNTLKSNLGQVLQKVQADYPGVPISLTGYYNPLPANQTVTKASVCRLMPILAEALLARTNPKEAVKAIATGQLTSNGVKFEQRLYQTAQSVLSSLNGTLSQEASLFNNVKFVPVDFTGRDFCEDYRGGNGGWVFGPSLHFTFGWTWGLLSGFYQRQYSPVDVCSSSLYWCYHRFVNTGSGKKLGFSYSYTFTASTNEFPHPTAAGQQEIADLIKTQLGL